MPGELTSKVAVVTGGGWNIGRAIALRLAREGARVVVAARRPGPLDETVDAIRAAGGEALAVPTDVADWEQVRRLAERTLEAFGSVDALLAIAGGGAGHEPVDRIDPAAWADVIGVNLVGTFHAVRAFVPAMKERAAGAIVTCAGGGSLHPLLGAHATAYASAKAALCRLTDQLAVELMEHGIRVNCLLPGPTPAPDELRRIEEEERSTGRPHPDRAAYRSPEESAELAAWLVSERSAPLSGRIVSPEDEWWRDPAKVLEVQGSLHAYCLRRQELA